MQMNECLIEFGDGLAVSDVLQRLFDEATTTCEEDSMLRTAFIGAKALEQARDHLDEIQTNIRASANQMEFPANPGKGEGGKAGKPTVSLCDRCKQTPLRRGFSVLGYL